jgi:hypothetical protein
MKEKREGKKKKWFIAVGAIIILAIIILGTLYFSGFFNHKRFGFPRQDFQLNESQINNINSFFSSNPSASDIQNYCSTNRDYCFYYCRNLNPTSDICSSIMNFSRPPQVGAPQ